MDKMFDYSINIKVLHIIIEVNKMNMYFIKYVILVLNYCNKYNSKLNTFNSDQNYKKIDCLFFL